MSAETFASVYVCSVPPRLCDAQGVVHAIRYYELFEDAFLHWLDSHVGGYAALRSAAEADLMVVASGCQHRRGGVLGDKLAIDVRAKSAGRTSMTMSFTVQNGAGDVLVDGTTTYVTVRDGRSAPLPAVLRALTPTVERSPQDVEDA
jgi:acyl-CoA thioesterase FadM